MVIGGIILVGLIVAVAAFALFADSMPVTPARPYTPTTPSRVPELNWAAEQITEPEYTICPSCGNKSLEEWVGDWSEQFGQGEIIHQGVPQWKCHTCSYSGFQV